MNETERAAMHQFLARFVQENGELLRRLTEHEKRDMDIHQARKDEIVTRLSGITLNRDAEWLDQAAIALNWAVQQDPDHPMPNDPVEYRERLDDLIVRFGNQE